MKNEEIWHVFAETGDPVVYLLYKSAGNAQSRRTADTGNGPGKLPRPAD